MKSPSKSGQGAALREELARVARGAKPWAALVLLALAFELPLALLGRGPRVPGEMFLLLCALLASRRFYPRRWLSAAIGIVAGVLIVVRVDRVGFGALMGEEPLLYDQLFLVRHLFVLSSDLWSLEFAAVLAAAALGVFVVVVVVRRLLRAFLALAEPPRTRQALVGLVCAWVAALSVSAFGVTAIDWTAPALAANVEQSLRVQRAVRARVRRSPYAAYAELRPCRRPNVYLVFVESYGRFIADDAATQKGWVARAERMQARLSQAGWSARSAFSQAPVSGGRSWLAEASVLTGTRVRYEAVFHDLVRQMDRVPNLVSFLAGQGYRTVLLAPADRERPGVEEVDYYPYDRTLRFDDLQYVGPRVGWGLVPDQYSLAFTQERVLTATQEPLFLNFHMVSSHAPWREVPHMVRDWHALNNSSRGGDEVDKVGRGPDEVLRRLKRYRRTGSRYGWMGQLTEGIARSYQRAIFYTLSVVERFLSDLPGDALVIVMGDHQPPIVAGSNLSYDVPVHVLARDPELLRDFEQHGFAVGMVPPAGRSEIAHEGLFSLVVRSLTVGCGEGFEEPAYHPRGVRLRQ